MSPESPASDALELQAIRLALTKWVSPERIRDAVADRLDQPEPVSGAQVLADLIVAARKAGRLAPRGEAAALQRRLARSQVRTLVACRPGYPVRLAQAWPELGAPVWCFYRGLPAVVGQGPAVAVVGTRRPTLDGLRTARELGRIVVQAGGVVISGLARGIDQAAHRGALEGGGATIAVLGSGFGVDYPSGSASLRREIASSGGLVSEYVPGAQPAPHHFLWRNRLISGLADVTVVVEGRERSGALATARLAAAQGREVLAVPGSLHSPQSQGPLALIRDGVRPLTSINEILETVGLTLPGAHEEAAAAPLDPDAHTVLSLLGPTPATADELAATSGLTVARVLAAAAAIEASGLAAATSAGLVAVR